MAGFLHDLATVSQNRGLTLNLVANVLLNRAEGVDVLGFSADTQRRIGSIAQRHVHVRTHVTALHAGLRNPNGTENITQGTHIGGSYLGGSLTGTLNGAGHDLHQRHTSAVVVHQRVFRTLNTSVGATNVGVLTGVFFHVGALNGHAENFAVF